MTRALCLVALSVLAAGCGSAAPHRLRVGAVEDVAKAGDAKAAMQLAARSGFDVVVLSSTWTRGLDAPAAGELESLRRAAAAAVDAGVAPVVAIYSFSSSTPLDESGREEFAAYAAAIVHALPQLHAVIVGNEPNLNLFWLPQFTPDGQDAAARAFEALLAQTYDAVKKARSDVEVIGAGLAARGSDDPQAARQTHSPTRFLLDLGAAYRASGRRRPIMDALSLHPYGETPRVPPTLRHPHSTSLGIADYEKVRELLGRAFGGTAQDGRDLPIVYGEYGVETRIPPAKAALYSGSEVVEAVPEQTQARYYRSALELAACQPTVELLLFFHVQDEPRLEGLQSGTRYADGSPKTSMAPVRAAIRACAHSCCGG
ncbi:MAG TPA: hypothetical protein VGC78_07915 [Gaiellaceae bacterium]